MFQHFKRFAVPSLFFLLSFVFAASAASAQSVRGAIAGSITDTTGAFIPNASITAINQENGGKSVTRSTGAGVYRFPDLPIGTYTVTVTAQGFQTKTSTGVLVQVNGTTALNVSLPAGAVNEVVTVDASGNLLQTESSDIGGTVSNKQIEDLPLSLQLGVGGLRSPETFVFLLPGTTGPGTGTAGNTANGVFFSRLSGGQAYGAEVLLDGASIQRSENGSSFDETSPSIEALQEFKVTTSTPSAEFGRTTSGIESFSVKSGTNQFHGTGYAIVKNRVFDANNWFNNGYKAIDCVGVSEVNCAYSKPQDSKYDYGGVFDGPVRIPHIYNGKDRTFFLFAWEKFQLHLGSVIQSTVPTAAERTGDFSDILGGPVPGGSPYPGVPYDVLLNPCTGMPVLYNQIFDPTTTVQITPGIFCRTPFPNNKIDLPLSQAAQKLMAGLPLPNQTPTSTDVFGYINNYSQSGVAPNTNTTYTIRIDQNLSDKSKIFATYSTRQNFKLTGAPDFPEPFNNNGYIQTFTTHYGRAGWDYTFMPTLLNHLNLGYNRTNSVNLGANLNSKLTAASAGVANDYSVFYPLIVFPSPDQPSTLGQQQNGDNIDNGVRINDSVSWQKGRNSFKFGVDIRFQQYSVIDYNVDTLNFYRDQTAGVSNSCCGSGAPYASFLLGEVGNGSQNVYNVHPRWNSHYMAGFVEDDLKFSNNLTLNLGLRYSVDAPRHEADNETSELSLTAPDAAAGGLPGALVFGTNCHCNTAWADTWYKDIAPRLGFAYVLPGTNQKLVLRGGGAVLYGPLQYNDFGADMTEGYNQVRDFFDGQTPTTGGAFTPAFRLDSSSAADPTNSSVGYPDVSYAPNLDPTQLTAPNGPGSFQAVIPGNGAVIRPFNGRPSMTSNWSLQLQDELAKDLIFTIGYIGQVAQNLRTGDLSNTNNISTQYFQLGDRLDYSAYFIPLGGSVDGVNAPYANFEGELGQALRPFPQYDYIQGDCCLENLGHSSYNAMVVSLARRFRNGFNLQASYTWSKDLTDADSTIPFSYVAANQLQQAEGSSNLKLDKAVSVQNTPQQFSLSYLYQLPFGRGRRWLNTNRALDLLIGGWQVGAIQRYQSGQPIGFGCATAIPYYQNCIAYDYGPASDGGKDFASAAYKANKNHPSAFNGESWFKPAYRVAGTNGASDPGVPMSEAAFVDQNREGVGWPRPYSAGCGTPTSPCSFAPFELGNLPRETEAITGPIYKAEDVSLIKDFHITERVVFQLKGEAFDIFNRHRMGLPDQSPQDSANLTTGFGIPGAVDYGPRTMQVTGRFSF
ncbi:MAG TPA: carboxypeptidase-like regulatory domain-containing protein [Acidobacteriaceae bacterium]|jgi:hypothetical protein|nr:carboxypeptidase-like regulatory domain-containing protein [Acidobacteriaceae bacterium]